MCSLFTMCIFILLHVVSYNVPLVHHVYLYSFTCCWLSCVPCAPCVFVFFYMLLVLMSSLLIMCVCILLPVVDYDDLLFTICTYILLHLVCNLLSIFVCVLLQFVGYVVFLLHYVYMYSFKCCWLWCVHSSTCVFVATYNLFIIFIFTVVSANVLVVVMFDYCSRLLPFSLS